VGVATIAHRLWVCRRFTRVYFRVNRLWTVEALTAFMESPWRLDGCLIAAFTRETRRFLQTGLIGVQLLDRG
jgi:hypothetical protein